MAKDCKGSNKQSPKWLRGSIGQELEEGATEKSKEAGIRGGEKMRHDASGRVRGHVMRVRSTIEGLDWMMSPRVNATTTHGAPKQVSLNDERFDPVRGHSRNHT